MKLSIVLSTHTASFEALAYSGNFAENVAHIAALGYDGVELAVRNPELLDQDKAIRIIRDARLEVPAIGTGQAYHEEGLSFTDPNPDIRRKAVERIKAQIDFAACLGAQVIIGLIRGRVADGVQRQQAHVWMVAALEECVSYAAPKGVTLSLEAINRYETDLLNTVGASLEAIAQVGAENLGLLFDTFHMNIEAASLYADLVAARQHLVHVHLADSNRWYPGAGHVDFAQIVRTLASLEYDGYLSAEILPLPDADTSARETIRYMRPILEFP